MGFIEAANAHQRAPIEPLARTPTVSSEIRGERLSAPATDLADSQQSTFQREALTSVAAPGDSRQLPPAPLRSLQLATTDGAKSSCDAVSALQIAERKTILTHVVDAQQVLGITFRKPDVLWIFPGATLDATQVVGRAGRGQQVILDRKPIPTYSEPKSTSVSSTEELEIVLSKEQAQHTAKLDADRQSQVRALDRERRARAEFAAQVEARRIRDASLLPAMEEVPLKYYLAHSPNPSGSLSHTRVLSFLNSGSTILASHVPISSIEELRHHLIKLGAKHL